MPIIYTYPVKAIPNANDLILISDSQAGNDTKQIKVSTLPGSVGAGVSSVTSSNTAITIADSTSTPVLTSVAYTGGTNIGHVPTGSGDEIGKFLNGRGGWTTPPNTTYTGSSGVTLTGTDFTNTDKGSLQFIFKNIAVSGQDVIAADSNNDTLTFAGGGNTTLTTNADADTVTITSNNGWDVMNLAHGSQLSENSNDSYYYQVVSPSSFTLTKVKINAAVAGGSSNFKIAIYRGLLSNLGATAVLGQGQISPTTSGIYEVTLTETYSNSLNLTAGDNIILGFFHTVGDKLLCNGVTPISDTNLAIVVSGVIANFPSTLSGVSGSATILRPCCTLY